jgi:hypothetical protein
MHLGANVGKIGDALLGLNLDQRAALKVDAEVQADLPDEQKRHHGQ